MNKASWLNDVKTRTAIDVNISVFVNCIKAIIYLLLYNLHECTFNSRYRCYVIFALERLHATQIN